MGRLFGGGKEKAGNIAGFTMILGFLAVGFIIWLMPKDQVPWRDLLTLFGGVITTAVGFAFGRGTHSG